MCPLPAEKNTLNVAKGKLLYSEIVRSYQNRCLMQQIRQTLFITFFLNIFLDQSESVIVGGTLGGIIGVIIAVAVVVLAMWYIYID